MAGPEHIQNIVTEKLNSAIYGIRDARIPGISDIANRSIDKINRHDLIVVSNTPDFVSPSVTGFDLLTVSAQPRLLLRPVVVMDFGKVLESSTTTVQADLVRTLAIADTFPDKGYQNRLHDVYGSALDVQKKWLENKNVGIIAFDPRKQEKEDLIKRLIGDERYQTDFGMTDWNNACKALADADDPAMKKHGHRLLDNATHLVSMRHGYAIDMYNTIRAEGMDLSKKTLDGRAEIMAHALLGVTLLSPNFQP